MAKSTKRKTAPKKPARKLRASGKKAASTRKPKAGRKVLTAYKRPRRSKKAATTRKHTPAVTPVVDTPQEHVAVAVEMKSPLP